MAATRDDPGPEQHERPGAASSTGHDGRQDAPPTADRDETPVERADRNWNEILQELRVTQTGIQILTGFLLTVPFQQRFTELSTGQVRLYLALVVGAALTTGLLVAPVSLHRWLFRKHAKPSLVGAADRLMRFGLVFLAVVVSGVVLLVFDVVVGTGVAVAVAGALLAILVLAWFVLPVLLARPRSGRQRQTALRRDRGA